MNKKVFLRTLKVILIFTFVLSFIAFPMRTSAKRVIRVAYPFQQGLTMKDENNNYYGYDYDYLMQVAQYTGWTYEFVEVEGTLNERLSTLLKMLQDGEIDLMGGMKYAQSLTTMFDYPSEPYGNAYNVLAVDDKSDVYDFNTLINTKNLKIAVLENATARIEKLDQYAQMNGFQYEKIICKDQDDLTEKVEQGEAHTLLTVDLSMPKNFHSITRFSPDPFFFTTTKGNSDIIIELNQALENIRTINPTLSSNLYDRYFNSNSQKLHLNVNEEEYIKQNPTARVLVRDGIAPIQSVKDGEVTGIGKDILDVISQESGLYFEYIYAKDYDDYVNKLEQENIDFVMGIPYEMSVANDLSISLSDPYMSNSVLIVTKRGVDPTNKENLSQGITHFSNLYYDNNQNLIYYNSPEEILENIHNGNVDYTYINQYLYTYYMNKHQYSDLTSFQTPEYYKSQYAFGVKNDEQNLVLLSILNKGMNVAKKDMESFVYKNGYVERTITLSSFIRDNLLFVVLFTFVLISVVVASIWYYYRHQLKMKKEVELEYQRYLELAEITGEMTFSYDYRKDELKISRYSVHRLAEDSLLHSFLKTAQSEALESVQGLLTQAKDTNLELELTLLDSKRKWYSITLKMINDIAKTNKLAIYAVGKIQDIQEEYEKREVLRKKSQTDILTGLLNRAGAQEYIPQRIQNQVGNGYLLMIDLDNFKDVNDTFGHLEGDVVLKQTANVLKNIFKDGIIARLGGDEFMIYCDHISEQELETLCKAALKATSSLPFTKQHNISISMSIGVASTHDEEDYTALIKQADKCLYSVKRSGRNNYHMFHCK